MLKKSLLTRAVLMVMLAVLLIAAPVLAQNVCPADDVGAFDGLVEACANAPFESACSLNGDSLSLTGFVSTNTNPRLIRLSGSGDSEIDLVLVGAQLTSYTLSEAEPIGILEIGNRAGYNVNLRGGPGSNFDVVGTFRFDERLMVDGQTADGLWLRIVNEDGTFAWVSTSLVAFDPAIAALPIVDANTLGGMRGHVVTLTADPSCGGDVQTGAFITTTSESAQRFTLNNMPVSITAGAMFVWLNDSGATFYALSGNAALGVGEERITLAAGDVVEWDDTLVETDPVPPFPSLALINALAIDPDVCLVTSETTVDTFDQPVMSESATGTFDSGITVLASEGALTDDVTWLRLDVGWIRADDVSTLGDCDALLLASATPAPGSMIVAGTGLTPDQVMMEYLNARLVADGTRMQSLACAAYDTQALLQAQAFRAMRAELLGVSCSTTAQSGTAATVFCGGVIQTEYNGELRQWELGAYTMTQENGAWRVCGEAG